MKTAMQELIEKLKAKGGGMEIYLNANTEIINEALEKEKEQIKDAWDAGMSEGIGTTMADLDWDGEFINYFNETYTI